MLRQKQGRFAAILLMGMTMGATVRADGALDAHQALQAAYDHFATAMHRKDAEGATADFASDFTELDSSGATIQGGIPTERQQLQALFLYSRSITVRETIQKITLHGKRATVTVQEQIVLDSTKQTPQGVRPLTFQTDDVHEDVWVHKGRRWLRQSTKMLSIQEALDGKPDTPRPFHHARRRAQSASAAAGP